MWKAERTLPAPPRGRARTDVYSPGRIAFATLGGAPRRAARGTAHIEMFDTLTKRLTDSLQRLTGRGRITEENIADTVRQIRMALLEADVALSVVKTLVERVRERALGTEVARSLNPGQAFVKIVHDELVSVLGEGPGEVARRGNPVVLMLVGLQGSGKTTTAAKLARYLPRHVARGEVLLASTDVYRPAALAQLAKLASDVGARWHETDSREPAQIARGAVEAARQRGAKWLVLDTAGRLHVDEAMMAEARVIHETVAPAETLFVLDSMAGQDAVNSAKAFHEALPLSGVVLTKADGDARGGAALSVREVTGLPIKLVGTGEKPEALEAFDAQRIASRILGMGDVVGLVEQAHERLDREAAERVTAKVKRGRQINLEDFREQLRQLMNMGGIGAMLEKLPGANAAALKGANLDERQLRRQVGIIDAMTPRERRYPQLIDGSRKRRIAAGAGLPVQEVNRLLKQHRQLAKTMKRLSKGGGIEKMLGGRLPGQGPFARRPGR
jgi:signal recognition particle subunit SRP54